MMRGWLQNVGVGKVWVSDGHLKRGARSILYPVTPYKSVCVLEFICKYWFKRYSRTYSPISSTVSARGRGGGGDVSSSDLGVGSGIWLGTRSGHLGSRCARAPGAGGR